MSIGTSLLAAHGVHNFLKISRYLSVDRNFFGVLGNKFLTGWRNIKDPEIRNLFNREHCQDIVWD